MTAKILVVEDEESIIVGLQFALEGEGYDVELCRDGGEALERIRPGAFDLVVLDVMLPTLSGFDVLEELQRRGVNQSVLMLTARNQELDKVRGLDLGAADYVTKPFGLAELLARVRARLRLSAPPADRVPNEIVLGPVTVQIDALVARHGESVQELSLREVEMIKLLWIERGKPVSRDRFLTEVWGQNAYPGTRTVDQHVARLRQKIEADPAQPRHLLTVFGVGYRLDP